MRFCAAGAHLLGRRVHVESKGPRKCAACALVLCRMMMAVTSPILHWAAAGQTTLNNAEIHICGAVSDEACCARVRMYTLDYSH